MAKSGLYLVLWRGSKFSGTFHPLTNPRQPRGTFRVWGKPVTVRVRRATQGEYSLWAGRELYTLHVLAQGFCRKGAETLSSHSL